MTWAKGPWMATCYACGEELRFYHTRKQAKDALHRHRMRECVPLPVLNLDGPGGV